ncbi:hypothetical protein Taro_003609, partial [Colocasia esculenta]|nr:hypothetical protein [Colocasia esculenta]
RCAPSLLIFSLTPRSSSSFGLSPIHPSGSSFVPVERERERGWGGGKLGTGLRASSMEGGSLLHLESKGNVKAERNQKVSLMENKIKDRRGLADITNMMNQVQKSAKPTTMDQKIPNPIPPSSDKDCIAHLLKENTALLRLLGERNKIIEFNDLELQKLRVSVQQLQISVQQLQQQNWQLARANSQMLEDLNSGKDRLKIAQHQLGCTVAALNTIKLELEKEKKKLKKEPCVNEATRKEQTSITCEGAAVEAPLQDEKKACIPPSRKRLTRSLGSASVTNEAGTKENNRRKSSRRGSSNFKSQTCEPQEDLFEIEDVKFPVSSLLTDHMAGSRTVQQDLSVSSSDSCSMLEVKKEEDMDAGGSQDSHHSSVGRPSRRATMGVSYKEPPLNTKMRRLFHILVVDQY